MHAISHRRPVTIPEGREGPNTVASAPTRHGCPFVRMQRHTGGGRGQPWASFATWSHFSHVSIRLA